jgi:hypothetical protein
MFNSQSLTNGPAEPRTALSSSSPILVSTRHIYIPLSWLFPNTTPSEQRVVATHLRDSTSPHPTLNLHWSCSQKLNKELRFDRGFFHIRAEYKALLFLLYSCLIVATAVYEHPILLKIVKYLQVIFIQIMLGALVTLIVKSLFRRKSVFTFWICILWIPFEIGSQNSKRAPGATRLCVLVLYTVALLFVVCAA